MGLDPEPFCEERLMPHYTPAGRLRPAARSLPESLRDFLTPAVWKQAHRGRRGRRAAVRWSGQPLILVLLCMTWACGDSAPEQFEVGRACVAARLPNRRRPGRAVHGVHNPLPQLPLPVLPAVAAGVRQ